MTTSQKQNWSELSTEALSEEAIRALHVPAENFKLYSNSYAAAEQFAIKAGHEFILYVLTGACKTRMDGLEVRLNAGEWISMDAGSYAFEVLGNEPVQLVKVFSRV